MNDQDVLERINRLASEEHDLYRRASDGTVDEDERRRMDEIAVTLDQCWDLLRQRRALRASGSDPNEAEVRPERVVENYEN